jgi:hypothetical protein
MKISHTIELLDRIRDKYGDCDVRIDINGQHVNVGHIVCFIAKPLKYALISDGRLKDENQTPHS